MIQKKPFYLSIGTIFLLTGCSPHIANEDFKIQIENKLNSSKKIETITKKYFEKEEKISDNSYIDISSKTSLKTALEKLGEIDGNIYYLPEEQNIYLQTLSPDASKKLHIDSFKKLRDYIKDTSPYTIEIVKNKFKYNKVKVVNVFNRKQIMYDLKKVPFEITSPTSVSDALKEICELTGFNIVYKNDFDGNEKLSKVKIFDNNKIYFKGDNVFDFLSYISDMFNVYIDIDYDKKLITISKYKTKMFHLIIPEYSLQTQGSANINTGANQSSGSQKTKTVKSSINFKLTQKFISAIKKLISGDKKSKVLVDESGDVIVRTTKNNMRIVESMFETYNKNYSQQLSLNFEIYNFLLNKDFNIGIDLNLNGKDSLVTNYITNTIYSHTEGRNSVKATSDNTIIQLAKKYTFNKIVLNNIPTEISFINRKDYIKSIQTTTTTGTAATTQTTTTDIGTITQGQVLTILARIIGSKVFLKTELELSTLNNIIEKQIGNNTITLPDTSNNSIPETFIMRFGEKRIVGYYESYQDATKYSGIVPLRGFIIGGKNNKQYVRVLTVIVVSVNKVKERIKKQLPVHYITIQ